MTFFHCFTIILIKRKILCGFKHFGLIILFKCTLYKLD